MMAYLDFGPLEADSRASASDAGLFSSTELRVIKLAERFDASRELAHHSRFGRFIEKLFGIRLPRPLADPRLEILRRFASRARHHGDEIGEADIHNLIEAGYSAGQAYGLLAWLSGKNHHAGR